MTQTNVNRLRICYLAPSFPVLSETFVYREINGLVARGHHVDLVALRKAPDTQVELKADVSVSYLYDAGIAHFLAAAFATLFRAPSRFVSGFLMCCSDSLCLLGTPRRAATLWIQWLAAHGLAARLERDEIDHMHAQFAHSPAQVAMYASRISGVPFSITGHANDIYERGVLLLRKAQRAKAFVTISDYNARHLRSLNLPAQKIHTIRVINDFVVPPRSTGQDGQKFHIGSLGRLVPKKGMSVLVEAIAGLPPEQRDRIQLDIAGDGPEKPTLQAMLDQASLHNTIRLVGGIAPHQVLNWMARLDLFALACCQDISGDIDGIPVVLMEAIAAGTPVLSTRLTGIPELIQDPENGWLAEPSSVESLQACLVSILGEPTQLDRRARAAKRHLDQEFGRDINLDRLLSIFQQNRAINKR